MAQILVRDLDEAVVRRLKVQAKKDNRSLQSEVKHILERSAVDGTAAISAVREIRARLKGRRFPDSAGLVREDRAR